MPHHSIFPKKSVWYHFMFSLNIIIVAAVPSTCREGGDAFDTPVNNLTQFQPAPPEQVWVTPPKRGQPQVTNRWCDISRYRDSRRIPMPGSRRSPLPSTAPRSGADPQQCRELSGLRGLTPEEPLLPHVSPGEPPPAPPSQEKNQFPGGHQTQPLSPSPAKTPPNRVRGSPGCCSPKAPARGAAGHTRMGYRGCVTPCPCPNPSPAPRRGSPRPWDPEPQLPDTVLGGCWLRGGLFES